MYNKFVFLFWFRQEEKRLKVEKKLEEDAKREKEKLMQEKRELFLEKKRREVEIKRIEWSLNRVKEYEAWEANVIPLKNFIQTQAKPHLFYLPCVHNDKTEERLVISQKLVESKNPLKSAKIWLFYLFKLTFCSVF